MKKNFLWGASESGFQFEMGDKEKKSLDPNTDWFAWVHDEENIKNKIVSGDLPENGIDYWDLFKIDHKIAKELGMNAYRIGIEWSRILNDVHDIEIYTEVNEDTNLFEKIVIEEEDLEKLLKRVNKKNVERYREIIEDLRSKDIKVIVCLNHFTLPLWIHNPLVARKTDLEEGPLGWADNLTVVEFTKFASVAAYLFGDLVDMWATLNEPFVVTELGYLLPEAGFPPGVASVAGYFTATANITNAHVRAYDAIKKWDQVKADDDSDVPAFVGIIHNMGATQPLDPNNEKDLEVAKFLDYARNRWLFNAIVRGEVDLDLDLQISDEEKILSFRNRLDWIGVNYYSRMVVKHSDKPLVPGFDMASFEIVEGYGSFCKPNSVSKDGRPTSDFGWEIYPEGLRNVLKIASEYKLPIYVTENGIADAQDKYRSAFIVQHVHQVELAIEEDKLDVRGYLHWALTDNYEWADGFSKRFGLVEVDLTTKERRKRKSAEIFKEIAQNSGLTDKLRKEYLTK
ncbi:MAG: beta-galactosidase BgaS [Candidatus Asgardarchaeia archaeon]